MQKWNFIWSFALLILGIVLLLNGYRDYKDGLASTYWPKVEGVITYSAAEDGHDSTSFARIEYTYKVNEKIYKNDRIYADSLETGMSRKNAEELAMKFPVGRHGPVSYEPKNPQNSLLRPGVSLNIWLPFYGGIVFLIFGIIHFMDIKKSLQKPRIQSRLS